MLGLHCCTRASSSCGERGLLFVAVHSFSHCSGFCCCGARALGTWASVVAACGLSSCGARAYLLRSMWDLPGPELEPVSPALVGGFFTAAPPGKPQKGNSWFPLLTFLFLNSKLCHHISSCWNQAEASSWFTLIFYSLDIFHWQILLTLLKITFYIPLNFSFSTSDRSQSS